MEISKYLSEILDKSINTAAEKNVTIHIDITPESESISIEPLIIYSKEFWKYCNE